MKINAHENFVIVEDKTIDIENFIFLLKPLMENQLKDKNLVINLLKNKDFNLTELNKFTSISERHNGNNKSFVIVNDVLNLNEVPDNKVVVPTLQEAEDLIEMEEIERELGL